MSEQNDLQDDDTVLDFTELSGENNASDEDVLTEVGFRILDGTASNEDYNQARDISQKYRPGEMFRISPKLVSREAALESLGNLKQYAGAGIALAIVLALISLIDHLFGGGDKATGGGGASADRLKKASADFEAASKRLKENEDALRELSNAIPKMTPEAITELTSDKESVDTFRKSPLYITITKAVSSQADLSDGGRDMVVKTVLEIARKYMALIGADDVSKLKEHFNYGLDIHRILDTDVFTANRNSWCRMAFLSKPGFEPSDDVKEVHEKLKSIMEAFQSYRENIDKMVNAVQIKSSDFDFRGFNALSIQALKNFGINVTEVEGSAPIVPGLAEPRPAITTTDALKLSEGMKLQFLQIEPTQVVTKNVLSKLIGADQPRVIEELKRFDEIADVAEKLKKWMETDANGNGDIAGLLKEIDSLKEILLKTDRSDEITSLNLASKIIRSMSSMSGNLIATAGNFNRGMKRVSVEFLNFTKTYGEISVLAERLNNVKRKAATESYASFTQSQMKLEAMSKPENVPAEPKLFMREVHIPKDVILPAGIDINVLRDLVEEDSSDWSERDLGEYIEGASASLESLRNDIETLSEIQWRMRRTGLVSRHDIIALEQVRPGLITNKTPIGRFTSFESVNYAQVSLESADNLVNGAKAVAGIAAIAIIAKILQWCFKRFQASRDVTKSIKGTSDVVSKLNDQVIATITGLDRRIEALSPDIQGQLSENAKKQYIDKIGNIAGWFNLNEAEKSMIQMRTIIFAKNHEKSYSELVDSLLKGQDVFKLVQALTVASEKGAGTLDKAIDNVANQIQQMKSGSGSNTEFIFKGLDFGLDSFSIKDLNLSKAAGNPGKGELITQYVASQKDKKFTKEQLQNVEVDKFNARMTELAEKLKEVNGRVDSEFKKIQSRLDKLEKANATSNEKDDSEGSAKANREAITSYIDSIRAEFEAYSKIVGAHKAILTVLDAEIKHYGKTLKDWKGHVDWLSKQITSLTKSGSAE